VIVVVVVVIYITSRNAVKVRNILNNNRGEEAFAHVDRHFGAHEGEHECANPTEETCRKRRSDNDNNNNDNENDNDD
jgi:hypothetical protein